MSGTPITDHLYPFFSGDFQSGIAVGNVSKNAIDTMSSDLNHSFSGTILNLNLKLSPQAGLKYIIGRKTGDLDFTLGYGLHIDWPIWSIWTLPGISTSNHVNFYRRNISHGLILGANAVV